MSPARISMGEMDFGRLANMRHVLDLSWANAERTMDLDVGHALTARRMDEAQVAGPRVYIGAHLHLLNAMDNLDALWALLQHHERRGLPGTSCGRRLRQRSRAVGTRAGGGTETSTACPAPGDSQRCTNILFILGTAVTAWLICAIPIVLLESPSQKG